MTSPDQKIEINAEEVRKAKRIANYLLHTIKTFGIPDQTVYMTTLIIMGSIFYAHRDDQTLESYLAHVHGDLKESIIKTMKAIPNDNNIPKETVN